MDFEWLKRRRVEAQVRCMYAAEIEERIKDRAWVKSDEGRAWQEAPWCVRKMVRGKRIIWCTRTAHRGTAQARADAHFEAIVAEQWALVDRSTSRGKSLTCGDLAALYLDWPNGKLRTRRNNVLAFYGIMRAIHGQDPAGVALARVDARSLREWQRSRQSEIAKRLPDVVSEEHQAALRGINDTLRQARSLFSKQALQFYQDKGHEVPASALEILEVGWVPARQAAPFTGVPEAVLLSVIDRESELEREDPSTWCALWLMLGAGLRNSEVERARWVDLRRDARGWQLAVAGKSAAVRTCVLADDIIARLERVRSGEYLVPGRTMTDRQDATHRRLNAWLRGCGMVPQAGKVAYLLRKAYAQAVEAAYGIRAAQAALGHEDAQTTLRHYLGRTQLPGAVSVV